MLGADPRALGQEKAVHPDLAAALRDLILRHAKEIPHLPKGGPRMRNRPVTIARVDIGGERYCLTRFEKEEGKKLSRQQLRIATLVMEGLSNKDIARNLGISPGTVASHLGQIYSKMNISNRASLARECLQIDPAPEAEGD